MALEDYFPETIFLKKYRKEFGQDKAVTKQLTVVAGEMLEVQEAYARHDYTHAMEELVDVMQATHNTMRLIPGYSNETVEDMIQQVILKNKKRGYYEDDSC